MIQDFFKSTFKKVHQKFQNWRKKVNHRKCERHYQRSTLLKIFETSKEFDLF